MLSLFSPLLAYNAFPAGRSAPSSACGSATIRMVERSAAIPFLKKPSALDGTLAGDVGFDPMGISTSICEMRISHQSAFVNLQSAFVNLHRMRALQFGKKSLLPCTGAFLRL